jgi:CAAX prenyl protease-like protein
MGAFLRRICHTPLSARVIPFAVFYALTLCQGRFGQNSQYWFYAGKTVVGLWMVWSLRSVWAEMEWRWSWEGVVAGVAVIALWIGLDGHYPGLNQLLGSSPAKPASPTFADWNVWRDFGRGSLFGWGIVAVRIFGSSVVVPPLEEIFYRSFLYRYVVRSDFQSLPLTTHNWRALVMTAGIFAFSHNEWLPGLLCGLAFQGLVCWKGRLGDAVAAHATANFLLGVWVVWKEAWNFW